MVICLLLHSQQTYSMLKYAYFAESSIRYDVIALAASIVFIFATLGAMWGWGKYVFIGIPVYCFLCFIKTLR